MLSVRRPTILAVFALWGCASEVEGQADVSTDTTLDTVDAEGESPSPSGPDGPDAVVAPSEPDTTTNGDAFCRLTSETGGLVVCPIRLVRAGPETPPAVGLDLVLAYDASQLRFVGTSTFACGNATCEPTFAPPALLDTRHQVRLVPASTAAWAGNGAVNLARDNGLEALSLALASDLDPRPVLWLAFELRSPAMTGEVRVLVASANAPPDASLQVVIEPGLLRLEGVWTGPLPECLSDTTCADDLACTADSCDISGTCSRIVAPGTCAVDNTCVAAGVVRADNPCEVCDPASFTTAWTARQGEPCDTGDPCVVDGTCVKDVCVGTARDCDDADACTNDSCDSTAGCVHTLIPDCDADPCRSNPSAIGCRCVVGRARELGCGRVFVWGDEHVTYDSYGAAPQAFWERTLRWMSAANASSGCGVRRTRVAFAGVSVTPAMEAALTGLGLEHVHGAAVPPANADILVILPYGGVDPLALRSWVEAGGAVMSLVVGVGGTVECDSPNAALAELGYRYECATAPPWGPVALPSVHPILGGLGVDNVPFVNGRWVVADVDVDSGVVGRVDADTCPP